jgi:hypothetical protein
MHVIELINIGNFLSTELEIFNHLTPRSSLVTNTGVWMGSNTIRGEARNWDNQPNFLSTATGDITPEKCMVLERSTLETSYVNCRSDSSSVRGAVCVRYGTGN